jgi:hypothetical protein
VKDVVEEMVLHRYIDPGEGEDKGPALLKKASALFSKLSALEK